MGLIKLEYVIRYSSQDPIYKAENLLDNLGSKPWLCSIQDKSGHLEAEFQLDKASCIDFIDIGNFGSSTVEIQVGKSLSQQKTNYVSLLPAVGLLTSADVKAGLHRNSVYMFDKNEINKNVAEEKWDQVKVICCQHYNKKIQFGLTFLSMRNKENFSKLNIDENFAIDRSYERFPKGFSENSPPDPDSLMTRGKRMLNASKSKKNLHPMKRIGNIDADGMLRKRSANESVSSSTVKKKVTTSPEIIYLRKKMQQGRISKTLIQKKTSIDSVSSEFEDFKTPSKQQNNSKASTHTKIGFTRPEDFIQPDGIQPSTSSGITFVECPICREFFTSSEIEKHASTCGDPFTCGDSSGILELHNEDYFICPFCGEFFSKSEINIHAEKCFE